jgi:hypothetical protein
MKEIDVWPVSTVKKSFNHAALVTKYYKECSAILNCLNGKKAAMGGDIDIYYYLVNARVH